MPNYDCTWNCSVKKRENWDNRQSSQGLKTDTSAVEYTRLTISLHGSSYLEIDQIDGDIGRRAG